MDATRSSDPRALIPRRAAGYGWRGDRFENRSALSENAYAAGAIASTIRDMARWEAALHAGKLLSKESYDEMWKPLAVSRSAIAPFSYGFGWMSITSTANVQCSTAEARLVSPRPSAAILAKASQ
jgi:CubicO group peptidase (beta-lactamase class C family)